MCNILFLHRNKCRTFLWRTYVNFVARSDESYISRGYYGITTCQSSWENIIPIRFMDDAYLGSLHAFRNAPTLESAIKII